MKYIFITLIIFLCSCSDRIITTANTDLRNYRIEAIAFNDTLLCRYIANTNIDYYGYQNKISFIDTIGKYRTGDWIKATFIKTK